MMKNIGPLYSNNKKTSPKNEKNNAAMIIFRDPEGLVFKITAAINNGNSNGFIKKYRSPESKHCDKIPIDATIQKNKKIFFLKNNCMLFD
ncbi:MAG: hypothetical protein QM737_00130 [Ferruginibacter sp.]